MCMMSPEIVEWYRVGGKMKIVVPRHSPHTPAMASTGVAKDRGTQRALPAPWVSSTNRETFMREYTYPTCGTHPSYVPIQDISRIVACGDFHGDYDAAVACLRDCARVMNVRGGTSHAAPVYTWIAPPQTYVVILGDVVDRLRDTTQYQSPGEVPFEEIKVLDMINQLAQQATAAGSAVLRLLGNHEFFNLNGTFTYVTPYSLQTEFDGDPAKRGASFRTPHATYNSLLVACNPKIAVQLGPFLFCHGGFTPKLVHTYAALYYKAHNGSLEGINFLDYVNTMASNLINNVDVKEDSMYAKLKRAMFDGGGGDTLSVWTRTFGTHEQPYNPETTKNLFLEFQRAHPDNEPLKRLVVAHCTQFLRGWSHRTQQLDDLVQTVEDTALSTPTRIVYTSEPKRMAPGSLFGINFSRDFRVVRIDVGMSRSMDNSREWPLLEQNNMAETYCLARRPAILNVTVENGSAKMQTIVARRPLFRDPTCNGEHHARFISTKRPTAWDAEHPSRQPHTLG